MKRRQFLFVLGGALCPTGARAAAPAAELAAVTRGTGDTPALERLGVWLQAAAIGGGVDAGAVLRALGAAQEADGYLGVYPPADRLGGSDRGVDEYWGTAELGRGLLAHARAGSAPAREAARLLGARLCAVEPDLLDRSPGQQHPAASALLFFLTGMARDTGAPEYARYLSRLPGRIGLPNERSPFAPALPPVLPGWGRDARRGARGLGAMSGMLALARHQEHALLAAAVRERWSALRRTLPGEPPPELLARWVRLTAELRGEGDQEELRAELKRSAALPLAPVGPYSELIRLLVC